MRSITSRTEGALIAPTGALSSKKESFVYKAKDSFFVRQGRGVPGTANPFDLELVANAEPVGSAFFA